MTATWQPGTQDSAYGALRPATWPPPVRPGDRVGVAALSGPLDPGKLSAGLDALRALGFEPVPATNLASRHGFLAGRDAERLAAFHELAADPSLGAIVFARGGHGLLRLLDGLDWELLARYPRAYVGYSDLTPFLLQVVARLGLVAFHGPMVGVDLARGLLAEEAESLLALLGQELPAVYPLASVEGGSAADEVEGDVEGPLLGGCLSLLTATLGTPFATDLAGALVFLEDVDEPAYRLDRMLTHLRLSGSLARIRGMIVGHLADHQPTDLLTGRVPVVHEGPDPRLAVLRELAGRGTWPLALGLEAGHDAPNLTLPLGAWARLEPASCRLVIDPAGAREPVARD